MEPTYLDISWPITNDITAYKDRHIVRIAPTKELAQDGARESLITLGSHTGTHIDAPAHFMANGTTVDKIPLAHLIGNCCVIDLNTCVDNITARDLESCNLQAHEIVLLKTANSALSTTANFAPNFVYLAADAAEFLVHKKIRTVGIDYLGIERNQRAHETHQKLLSAGIVILEGLRLGHVEAGSYNLICLPLLLPGLDASPARAILEKI